MQRAYCIQINKHIRVYVLCMYACMYLVYVCMRCATIHETLLPVLCSLDNNTTYTLQIIHHQFNSILLLLINHNDTNDT